MPKRKKATKKSKKQEGVSAEEQLMLELDSHYQAWTDDMTKRLTRKNGWNDVTDAFWGKLPDEWPYISKVVDPRVRTTIVEKNARLLNSKLRGKLVPREGADVVSATINNQILDFQWDGANLGGPMLTKLSICDQDTRLYGSKFAYNYWREELDEDGNVVFAGNEFQPLDIRDCGIDFMATHIRDAKWFQLRTWEYLEDLESEVDVDGKPMWKNMDEIKSGLKKPEIKQSRRDNEWQSRVKQLKGLEDRVGTDKAFPVLEVVTEYREDKWITFSPETKTIMREIDNPYDHGKIPITQLRYYPLQDDPLGESEVESVLPLWKAIQATVCSYMDEVILKMRPPLKIVEGAARIETIVYGPEAQWLVSNPDAVSEVKSNGEAVRYFQTTYPSLVSAFNVAMGDLSQGVSNLDPTSAEKTATEIRQVARQQNTRDEKNQTDLADFLKDNMMMWVGNNKQFMFRDPKKQEHILKIVGKENFALFEQAGLDGMTVPNEVSQSIAEMVAEDPERFSEGDIAEMHNAGKVPTHPIKDGKGYKPKMEVSETGEVADLTVEPKDMDGLFDYIPDVKSMALGASEELSLARQRAMQSFATPAIIESLAMEGWRPKFKEILSADLESSGLSGSERFFEKIQGGQDVQGQVPGAVQRGANATAGAPQSSQIKGLPELSPAVPQGGGGEQVAGPFGLQE